MAYIWFLLTVSLLALASYAAARWGADSRDDRFAMGRLAHPGRFARHER